MEQIRTWLTAGAVLAGSGIILGCATTVPMDADGDSGLENDAGIPPVDAGSDARIEPTACNPAACEVVDGSAEAYQPPWGCPEVCDDACTGDTVCCEGGQCQPRRLHGCTEGCDMELTVHGPLFQCPYDAPLTAEVCNRGTTAAAEPGQLVRFEGTGGMVCEAVTTTSIAPCTCVEVSCSGALGGSSHVRPILNPDDPVPDCGNPLGHIGRDALAGPCD
jgi:hypothetical protein